MPGDYLIGVDLGTSVVKATLVRADGFPAAHAVRSVRLRQPAPGQAEQEADDFVAAALSAVGEVVAAGGVAPAAVVAIGFDGQMGGIMGIDRAWNAATPWVPSTLDTRYLPYLDRVWAGHGDQILEMAGAVPIAAPRLCWWRAEHPALYARIHKVLMLANYVAGALAALPGDEAFMDPSYLTWMGMADTRRRAWSPDLTALWGIEAEKLPRIVPAATVIGGLSPAAAAACGLAAGTPLVAGAGDQIAGFMGAGLVETGQCIDVAGTFPVFAACADAFVVDRRYGILQPLAGPLGDEHWYWMTYISGGGLTHRWFCAQFGGQGPEDAAGSTYARLDAEAAAVPPGAEGLLFLPHLIGRSCPPEPDVRGAWLGFTWTHGRQHFYRALLEAVAYDYAQGLAAMRAYAPKTNLREVLVIGGGAASGLWNQIKADVLGLPYRCLLHADRATLGSALIGGHAVGLYPDLAQTAQRFAAAGESIEPQTAAHDHYAAYVEVYGQAFENLRELFTSLARLRERPYQTG